VCCSQRPQCRSPEFNQPVVRLAAVVAGRMLDVGPRLLGDGPVLDSFAKIGSERAGRPAWTGTVIGGDARSSESVM
jgi:hypothetical protein